MGKHFFDYDDGNFAHTISGTQHQTKIPGENSKCMI